MSSVRRNWLARLTNKCSADEDLEYYVREVADIVGLIGEGGERGGVRQRYVDDGGEGNTKAILSVVFCKIRTTPTPFCKSLYLPRPGSSLKNK